MGIQYKRQTDTVKTDMWRASQLVKRRELTMNGEKLAGL